MTDYPRQEFFEGSQVDSVPLRSWWSINDGLSLLESGLKSDLTVICQGHQFEIHSPIVGSRSGFFRAAGKDGFRVSHMGLRSVASVLQLTFSTGGGNTPLN